MSSDPSAGGVPPGHEHLHVFVRPPQTPVAAAQEADAADAARRYQNYVVRGPVFGLAAQAAADRWRWRVVGPVTAGFAQEARDALNSLLWFGAKDGTDDPAVRRELLAAVARLEREALDEVTAAGVRYRVVRGDEFLYSDAQGPERPRPTDPDPAERDWDVAVRDPEPDGGFVLDPIAPVTVTGAAERLALKDLRYRSARYPAEVREDSRRAAGTHPGVVLLPAAFRVLERSDTGWSPASGLLDSPHAARRALVGLLTRPWPGDEVDAATRASYARAAAAFRAAGDSDELRLEDGRQLLVARMRRLVRIGPDGPEPPRPSDENPYGPMKIHPSMDENGTITH